MTKTEELQQRSKHCLLYAWKHGIKFTDATQLYDNFLLTEHLEQREGQQP